MAVVLPAITITDFELAHMNFHMQSLKGSMPTDISKLSALTFLNLCYNLLHGSFTPWTATLVQMPQLIDLRICANWFYGTVPTSVINLTRLTFLTIFSNYLVGTIPPLPPSLVNFYVDKNFFIARSPSGVSPAVCHTNCFTSSPPAACPLSTQRPAAQCVFCGGAAGATGMCGGLLEGCTVDPTGLTAPNGGSAALLPQFCEAVYILPAQVSVLMALKSSLGVTDSTWVGTGECTGAKASQATPYWAGVRCSGNGAVTSIALRMQGASGSLHSSVSSLSALTSLDLSSNLFNQQLDGFLSDVYSLTQLKQLLLGYNWFYGSVPTTISQLSKLTGLSLFSNYLTGSLPSLPSSLLALDIAYNFLSGSLPTLPSTLSHCAAEHNCLVPAAAAPCARFGSTQRPAAVAGAAAATATERCAVCGMGTATEASVCFDGECVVSVAPAVVLAGPNGPVQAVQDLQCTGSSQASMSVATVTALLSLKSALGVTATAWGSGGCSVEGYTSGSDWPGVACDSLGNVVSIDLTSQKLKGSMASDVIALTSLTRLTFDSNLFWTPLASFVSYFSSLSSLVVLDLQYNWFYGTLPAYLLDLPNLTSLALGGNYLTGTVPKPTATTLAKLTLTSNFFTGSAEQEVAGRVEVEEGERVVVGEEMGEGEVEGRVVVVEGRGEGEEGRVVVGEGREEEGEGDRVVGREEDREGGRVGNRVGREADREGGRVGNRVGREGKRVGNWEEAERGGEGGEGGAGVASGGEGGGGGGREVGGEGGGDGSGGVDRGGESESGGDGEKGGGGKGGVVASGGEGGERGGREGGVSGALVGEGRGDSDEGMGGG
ncbi:unnamed protein product [Closterium sp. Naga37s-1]|nr:unnamed protein product [Closterium sp. Naga37s-1]